MIDYSFSIQELEIFLLIVVRLTCFMYAAPFYGMNNTPGQFKIALGIFTGYLVYFTTLPHEQVVYSTVLEYATIVLREAIVGLMIGWAANICSSIVFFAGRMVDMEIGLSMVNAIDPTTNENATITGFYYQYMVMLILIISGMHRYILRAIVQTYELIPLGGAVFHTDKLMDAILSFMSSYINIGFQICLPVFCAILIVNVVLAILAKVAPQMNMFAVGMQIKILVGLTIMFLTTGMLPYVSDYIYKEMKTMIVAFVEAMMP
jgi:flagellar biosynthetic protein FliR